MGSLGGGVVVQDPETDALAECSRKCGAGDLASKEVLCGDHRSVAEEKIDFKSRRLNAVAWFPQARSIY